jgi:hypothetical protein
MERCFYNKEDGFPQKNSDAPITTANPASTMIPSHGKQRLRRPARGAIRATSRPEAMIHRSNEIRAPEASLLEGGGV